MKGFEFQMLGRMHYNGDLAYNTADPVKSKTLASRGDVNV